MKRLFTCIILLLSVINYLEAQFNIDNELQKFANEKIPNTLSRDLTLETHIRNKKSQALYTKYQEIYNKQLLQIVSLMQLTTLIIHNSLDTQKHNDPIIEKCQKPGKQDDTLIITENDIVYYCNYIDSLTLPADFPIPKTNLVIPARYSNFKSHEIYNHYKDYKITKGTTNVLIRLDTAAKFALRNIIIRMFYATNNDTKLVLTSLFPHRFKRFGPLLVALNFTWLHPNTEEIRLDKLNASLLLEHYYESIDLETIAEHAFTTKYINKLQLNALIKLALTNNQKEIKLILNSNDEAIQYINNVKEEYKKTLCLDSLSLYQTDQAKITRFDLGITHNDIGKRVLELYLQEADAPSNNNKEKKKEKKATKDEPNDKEKCLIS